MRSKLHLSCGFLLLAGFFYRHRFTIPAAVTVTDVVKTRKGLLYEWKKADINFFVDFAVCSLFIALCHY
ncbi:MAG: hypothetical protein JW874_12710 [Spirochaetales bacterium]|nr:hypothetical protein [Spirochaetales bacterium]